MKSKFNSQHGAVLAFSLVMLLLLTLAGTRMIQQNKLQLQMAVYTREQTQKFANAEGLLAEAVNIINATPAHDNYYSGATYFPTSSKLSIHNSAHQCTPMSSYKQDIGLAGPISGLSGATVLSVSCLPSNKSCTSYDKTTAKLTCHPVSGDVDCTGETPNQVAAHFSDTVNDICYQPYDPMCEEDVSTTNNPRCMFPQPSPLPSPRCPKEVYKIEAISSGNDTVREIISDHVIACGS